MVPEIRAGVFREVFTGWHHLISNFVKREQITYEQKFLGGDIRIKRVKSLFITMNDTQIYTGTNSNFRFSKYVTKSTQRDDGVKFP